MIRLENENSGMLKECPESFSLTTLLFGFFVPAVRGMYGYAAIWLIASMITMGLAWLILPFTINKAYVKFLLEKGYKPESEDDFNKIRKMGISLKSKKTSKEEVAA